MTTSQSVITILVVVLGTMLTRFLPFIIFPAGKTPPKFITYLGGVLPYAVIGLLVIYCLKDAVFTSYHGLPELIAIVCIILHKMNYGNINSNRCRNRSLNRRRRRYRYRYRNR